MEHAAGLTPDRSAGQAVVDCGTKPICAERTSCLPADATSLRYGHPMLWRPRGELGVHFGAAVTACVSLDVNKQLTRYDELFIDQSFLMLDLLSCLSGGQAAYKTIKASRCFFEPPKVR